MSGETGFLSRWGGDVIHPAFFVRLASAPIASLLPAQRIFETSWLKPRSKHPNQIEYSLEWHRFVEMVDVAKIGARGDIIRLTPEFNYYLLAVARDADVLDDETRRMLAATNANLDDETRECIDRWAQNRKWPYAERIAAD